MFIVIEGIDGSGTTTQTARLQEKLVGLNVPCVAVAEPTGSPIGQFTRAQIKKQPYGWATMAMLFSADRQLHSDTVICPALREGKVVISDRHHLSTLCYQLASAQEEEPLPRRANELRVEWLHGLAAFCIEPDLVFCLRVPVSVALQRLSKREERDYYENEARLTRIAEQYERFQFDHGIVAVDGTQSEEEVAHDIWEQVKLRL